MIISEFKEKLEANAYRFYLLTAYMNTYVIPIVEPMDEFVIVKSDNLTNVQAVLMYGFIYKRDTRNRIIEPLTPAKVYCYNKHILRKEFAMTTCIDFTTVDNLMSRVIDSTQSLINLFETK